MKTLQNPMEAVDLFSDVVPHSQLRTVVAMLLDKSGYALVRDIETLKLYLCEKHELNAILSGKVKP